MDNFRFLLFLYIGVFIVYTLTPYPELFVKYPSLDSYAKKNKNI